MADKERFSVAEEPSLITDEDERARLEAKNTLRQYDRIMEMVDGWLQQNRNFDFAHLQYWICTGLPWTGSIRSLEIAGPRKISKRNFNA